MSSDELPPAVLPRVGALCRVLLQVRLLLAALTLLFALRQTLTPDFLLAFAGAVFSSWFASRYWDRIAPHLVRHPILVGLDVVISYGILSLGGPLGPFFLFTVVTAAIAGLLYRWRGVAYVCLLQVIFYYGALATVATTPGDLTFQTLVGQPAYYPVVGFVGVAVRRLLDEHARTDQARHVAEVAAAAADERARLAREMHDSLAKTLRGIAMAAAALPAWIDRSPERAASEAHNLASSAEIASREARDLIRDLRAELDRPLAEIVRDIATHWSSRTEVPVTLDCAEDADLPLIARYEAVAIFREALANTERHSAARSVHVRLARNGDHVALAVRDDGCGFELGSDNGDESDDVLRDLLHRGHYGLVGMHERARRAGGSLSVTSASGRGTQIAVTVPVGDPPIGSQGGDRHVAPPDQGPSERPAEADDVQ